MPLKSRACWLRSTALIWSNGNRTADISVELSNQEGVQVLNYSSTTPLREVSTKGVSRWFVSSLRSIVRVARWGKTVEMKKEFWKTHFGQ